MKILISIFFLVLGKGLLAQAHSYTGTYELHSVGPDSSFELKRSIILNDDGTFKFHHYNMDKKRIPSTSNIWSKGTWTAIKNQIHFSTNEETDIDEKYSVNFNGTKARYKTKSPRDISNKVIKTSLVFYQSEILIVKGHELFKKE